jgi:hypothetical protein
MTATALVGLLHLLDAAAIPTWLDGGWGVDALLQTQTRSHKDAAIFMSRTSHRGCSVGCRKAGCRNTWSRGRRTKRCS